MNSRRLAAPGFIYKKAAGPLTLQYILFHRLLAADGGSHICNMVKLYFSRFQPQLHGCNLLSLRLVAMLCILCIVPKFVDSRGRMMEPVQRSSLWRRGFDTPVNSDDDALNCGGKWRQQHDNKGKCGVCGDPYDNRFRDHEAGGKYASGIISNRYTTNDTSILVVIDVTNFLGGYFEFRICPHNSFKTPVQQTCLDRSQLKIEGNRYRYYPARRGLHHLRVELPKGMACTQCILQWKWHTGKDWGICPDGIGRVGCGPQEEYVNCADIAIDPATPQDPDFGLNAGFFDFPLTSFKQENILNPNPDVIIPAANQQLPAGGIPLSMETIEKNVVFEPASVATSGTLDTIINMIEPKNGQGAPIHVFLKRSGDTGTSIEPKFEFFNREHNTSSVPAMTDTMKTTITPANTSAQNDEVVVLPFMGDNVKQESVANSSSNVDRVPEIYSKVTKVKDGTSTEAITMPNVDMGTSYINNLEPLIDSRSTNIGTGIDATFSQNNEKGISTVTIQSKTNGVHRTTQLYNTTAPGVISNYFDRLGTEESTGYIGTNGPTAAEPILLESGSTTAAGVNVSISTGIPSTSSASGAGNDTRGPGSLASRQTRSILRVPDLSIEATTLSLNQTSNVERTVQSQKNTASSSVISSKLESGTASSSQAGNLSIMPGRLFGVPLVADSGNQLSTQMNDQAKSLPTVAKASQEVKASSSSTSVQRGSTDSGSQRGTSPFDWETQTDLTSVNGWFRNVDGTWVQAFQMKSSGQNSQTGGVTTDVQNQAQTIPRETSTVYESWVQPTTTVPTIISSEASTWNEQSNQSQSIRTRIMSMMGQFSSGSGSTNESGSSGTLGAATSEGSITSTQTQPSQIQTQPIFNHILQALQTRTLGLTNTTQTAQLDTNIYQQLQALHALLLENLMAQQATRSQNWNTQGTLSSTEMSPGIGPDAWIQPDVVSSQQVNQEKTTEISERALDFLENKAVSVPKEDLLPAQKNSSRSQNTIQKQNRKETTNNLVETNIAKQQQQSNNVQESQAVKRGNIKQDITESASFQAENTITNGNDSWQSQSRAENINANAVSGNEVTSKGETLGKEAHTVQQTLQNKEHTHKEIMNVSAARQQDTQIDQQARGEEQGTNTISVQEAQMQTNKSAQMDNATSIDLHDSTQPVHQGNSKNIYKGQTAAISDQQISYTQTGNNVSAVSTKQEPQDKVAMQTQKEVNVGRAETKSTNITQEENTEVSPITTTPSPASDQGSVSWPYQSEYVVSTEANPSYTYKPEPSGADSWFLPDPVPLTTILTPILSRTQSAHGEQNTRGVSSRVNQGSQRSIYPRPDRLATMYLRNIFTQLSPETNPIIIVTGLTPDMLMRAGVNPRIAEGGNLGEIITALERVLGVSIRSRRRGEAGGPEALNLGGAGPAAFDSMHILGGPGAGTMTGVGHDTLVTGHDPQAMDGVVGVSDMRGDGRFRDPVQRRRQQHRSEVTRRRQFMQEMRMLQDMMQLLGLGPEPLEPGDPGYRPPGRQGLGGHANQAALLDPLVVAPGAGGASGSFGGRVGMGMGGSRSQISQINAVMEMIGL